jgi:hypothetical protein
MAERQHQQQQHHDDDVEHPAELHAKVLKALGVLESKFLLATDSDRVDANDVLDIYDARSEGFKPADGTAIYEEAALRVVQIVSYAKEIFEDVILDRATRLATRIQESHSFLIAYDALQFQSLLGYEQNSDDLILRFAKVSQAKQPPIVLVYNT